MTTHPQRFRKTGQRNYINVGHLVKCSPPGKGRSFLARVVRLDADAEGLVTAVNVSVVSRLNGDRHPDAGKARAFHPEQITRVRQPAPPSTAQVGNTYECRVTGYEGGSLQVASTGHGRHTKLDDIPVGSHVTLRITSVKDW